MILSRLLNTPLKISNPCIRCGKQRKISKEWTEKVTNAYGVSLVTFSESICPDPACQKIVMADRMAMLAKNELIKQNKLRRS